MATYDELHALRPTKIFMQANVNTNPGRLYPLKDVQAAVEAVERRQGTARDYNIIAADMPAADPNVVFFDTEQEMKTVMSEQLVKELDDEVMREMFLPEHMMCEKATVNKLADEAYAEKQDSIATEDFFAGLPDGFSGQFFANDANHLGTWATDNSDSAMYNQLRIEYDQLCEDFDNLIEKYDHTYEKQADSIAFLQEKLDQHDKEYCELEAELDDERSMRLAVEETLYDVYHALGIPSGDEELVVAYAKHYRHAAGRDEFEYDVIGTTENVTVCVVRTTENVEDPHSAYERAMKAIAK